MSAQWDGKVVMSTPGGPVIEMSLGEYIAWKDAEIERLTRERYAAWAEVERLRAEMQSAKADAWDDGYGAQRQMIEVIARKPSNPYR
jgi:hypothetical protein